MLDGLNKQFETSFEESVVKVENEIKAVEERKNEISEIVEGKHLTLQDQEFLRDEIKSLIETTTMVMNQLRDDLKIGSPPRLYEVFSTLANSKIAQLKELRELEKTIMNAQLFSPDIDGGNGKNKAGKSEITMTGSALLDLIKEAKEKNTMDKVDAEFIVVDDEDSKEKF